MDGSLQAECEGSPMKKAWIRLFFVSAAGTAFLASGNFRGAATASESQQTPQPAATVASVVDRDISAIEKLILDAAEAMPEDKFNFTPEALNIPGAEYKGVRSFSGEVKHLGASNWLIWSSLTDDKLPEGLKDGNGPANLQTKTEIIKFLKDSFAVGHRAAATLTPENILQLPGKSKSTRLHLAEFGVAHAYDHYGQMIEYLRMNGVTPPASRPKSD
jgi:DinB family protein